MWHRHDAAPPGLGREFDWGKTLFSRRQVMR
jgi:hypothetical protein